VNNLLVKTIGWRGALLHGNPCVFDRWRWLKRHLLAGPLRTLDVGCGSGAFTFYASKIGNSSLGISHDEDNNSKARTRAEILHLRNIEFMTSDVASLRSLVDRLGKFDQVVCLETIEHIKEDQKLVSDLSFALKPGGRLLLTTPFKYYRRLLGDRLSETQDGGHVRWGYTHHEMKALFEENGLRVVAQEYISGFVSQQLDNAMRLLGRASIRVAWVVTFPFRIFQVVDSVLTRLINYPYLSIGMVGVKQAPEPTCFEEGLRDGSRLPPKSSILGSD
jgi:2-polyprenyl-3-methyl-5-hydroxy-6-metoxy-1,4-benzoquinol methylase